MSRFEFKPLPEVYQVEVTTACQLECDLCHRDQTVARRGGDRHLDVHELESWVARGDFAGSYYVELQMSGEPLLHPHLYAITSVLKGASLLVGMSTNGLLLERKADAIRGLDAITVSVDSMDPDVYARRRPRKAVCGDGDLAELLRNIDALLANPFCPPYVDLQIVAPLDWTDERANAEVERVRERFPDPRVTARLMWDCFAVNLGRARFDVGREMCTNPWLSVSVQSDGTVVSCCYAWDHNPVNTYGNLNEQPLADIWRGERVRELREAHRRGDAGGWCTGCYRRSPFLIHLGFMPTFVGRDASKRSLPVVQDTR